MLYSLMTESGGAITLIPRRRIGMKHLDAAVFYFRFLYTLCPGFLRLETKAPLRLLVAGGFGSLWGCNPLLFNSDAECLGLERLHLRVYLPFQPPAIFATLSGLFSGGGGHR